MAYLCKVKTSFCKHQFIESKIINDLDVLDKTIYRWKFKDQKIVFTNGCFDIMHKGHVTYLNQAANLGDKLIVGINSDASVKTLNKGPLRPIQDENSRALILAALHYVDLVVRFNTPTPLALIERIIPHVLVKGGDWKEDEIVGSQVVKAKGGTVRCIDFLEGYSTTSIENKIRTQSKNG